jgi:hypothetical protein
MDTLSDPVGTTTGPPLTQEELAAARHDVPRRIGALPFPPGATFSRSLWLVFVGERGAWTHKVLPIDDRLDMPDREHAASLCRLVGMALEFPLSHAREEALVVLRRPAPAVLSAADAFIFRLVCQVAVGREAAPWTFYVTGPDGAKECFRSGLVVPGSPTSPA